MSNKQIEGIKECIDRVYGADCAYYDVDGFAIANEIYNAGYRKQIENETLEAVDMFRNLIVNRFIELCNYNDYGKINLLLIGETIDRIYDDVIAKMKGGAE